MRYHPFLTEVGWVEAGQLTIGDTILTTDGTTVIVEDVVIIDFLDFGTDSINEINT